MKPTQIKAGDRMRVRIPMSIIPEYWATFSHMHRGGALMHIPDEGEWIFNKSRRVQGCSWCNVRELVPATGFEPANAPA